MISSKNFYSQFGAFRDEELRWYTCGIACIAMVLDSMGRFQEFKSKGKNLEKFLKFLISYHVNGSLPVVQRGFVLNGEKIMITVGLVGRVQKRVRDVVTIGSKGYFPVFSLGNGYDHRASAFLFGKFAVRAGLRESYSFSDLVTGFRNGEFAYFLPSVHSFKGRGTHLVVMQEAGEDEKGQYVEVVDPSELDYKYAVKRFDYGYFEKIYNGFGTYIR